MRQGSVELLRETNTSDNPGSKSRLIQLHPNRLWPMAASYVRRDHELSQDLFSYAGY